jgi:hypothetical protein
MQQDAEIQSVMKRLFIIFNPYEMLLGLRSSGNWDERDVYITHGRDEKCTQNFSKKTDGNTLILVGRLRCRWECRNKVVVNRTRFKQMEWNRSVQDTD